MYQGLVYQSTQHLGWEVGYEENIVFFHEAKNVRILGFHFLVGLFDIHQKQHRFCGHLEWGDNSVSTAYSLGYFLSLWNWEHGFNKFDVIVLWSFLSYMIFRVVWNCIFSFSLLVRILILKVYFKWFVLLNVFFQNVIFRGII